MFFDLLDGPPTTDMIYHQSVSNRMYSFTVAFDFAVIRLYVLDPVFIDSSASFFKPPSPTVSPQNPLPKSPFYSPFTPEGISFGLKGDGRNS